ncbi:MAG: response regulator [Bacteroidota bacterium]
MTTRRKYRILLIDDEPTFHHLFHFAFEQAFEITSVYSKDIDGFFQPGGKSYDVILLDLELDRRTGTASGIELIPRLTNDLGLPVVVISHTDGEITQNEAMRHGWIRGFLSKKNYQRSRWLKDIESTVEMCHRRYERAQKKSSASNEFLSQDIIPDIIPQRKRQEK